MGFNSAFKGLINFVRSYIVFKDVSLSMISLPCLSLMSFKSHTEFHITGIHLR